MVRTASALPLWHWYRSRSSYSHGRVSRSKPSRISSSIAWRNRRSPSTKSLRRPAQVVLQQGRLAEAVEHDADADRILETAGQLEVAAEGRLGAFVVGLEQAGTADRAVADGLAEQVAAVLLEFQAAAGEFQGG